DGLEFFAQIATDRHGRYRGLQGGLPILGLAYELVRTFARWVWWGRGWGGWGGWGLGADGWWRGDGRRAAAVGGGRALGHGRDIAERTELHSPGWVGSLQHPKTRCHPGLEPGSILRCGQ